MAIGIINSKWNQQTGIINLVDQNETAKQQHKNIDSKIAAEN